MICLLLNSGFQLIKVKEMHWINKNSGIKKALNQMIQCFSAIFISGKINLAGNHE